MTKVKETAKKPEVVEKETPVQTPSEVQPKTDIPDATFVDPATHDTHDPAKTEIEETKENTAILKEDAKIKEEVREGVNLASSAADLSELQRNMVPHPLSGKPVYETASQQIMAEALKGNL